MQSQDTERIKISSRLWIQLFLKPGLTPSDKSQQTLVTKPIWQKSCLIHQTTGHLGCFQFLTSSTSKNIIEHHKLVNCREFLSSLYNFSFAPFSLSLCSLTPMHFLCCLTRYSLKQICDYGRDQHTYHSGFISDHPLTDTSMPWWPTWGFRCHVFPSPHADTCSAHLSLPSPPFKSLLPSPPSWEIP